MLMEELYLNALKNNGESEYSFIRFIGKAYSGSSGTVIISGVTMSDQQLLYGGNGRIGNLYSSVNFGEWYLSSTSF